MTQTLIRPAASMALATAKHWINRFEITNLHQLTLQYRLIGIGNLQKTPAYDKQVNQLVKWVAYDTQQPVALVKRNDLHWLAVPISSYPSKTEIRVGPETAKLTMGDEEYTLNLGQLNQADMPIAIKLLEYALNTPLMHNAELWSFGRHYYKKQPISAGGPHSSVDLYPGFSWNIVTAEGGRLFVRLDTTTRFVDSKWMTADHNAADPKRYQGSNCLYHFGHQWYVVKLAGLTDTSIAEHTFPIDEQKTADVFSYTRNRWSKNPPVWVRDLDCNSPAILYKIPGKDVLRSGALALCKRLLQTNEVAVARRHHEAITPPEERFSDMEAIIKIHFQQAQLCGKTIQVSSQPLKSVQRVFPIPAQRFGGGRVLGISAQTGVTDVVPPSEMGRARLKLLQDPDAGCLDTSSFRTQYLLIPQSLPRTISQDFQKRFERMMQTVSGQTGYRVTRIVYDNRTARGLYQQVEVIKKAVDKAEVQSGYGLLILPEHSHRDLHNGIKRKLWAKLQFQSALTDTIRTFYRQQAGRETYEVKPEQMGKYQSYLRNLALGTLVVNRKWPWALMKPLHYDVTIGIDVLNYMAGITFVYNQGTDITFQHAESQQPEKLSAKQIKSMLLQSLRSDLKRLNVSPRSIVIHRDGRTFAPEIEGIYQAVKILKKEDLLPEDVQIGIVDIRKTSADQTRIVAGESVGDRRNPDMGSYTVFDSRSGAVCTTGSPFSFSGTANPLSVIGVEGDLNMEWVMQDIFDLSQLVFSAPDRCQRLPATIKIADDFLEPLAGFVDEDALNYDSEDEDTDKE